ncbi:tissue factor pathway inhibitor 2, partial [Gracilinanus agilis]|uniref:tissue factor pathway inhibitor 2 n=1 Tax=Gracilinanus agilis TaxID=191870 RepID=UPI001CFDC45B
SRLRSLPAEVSLHRCLLPQVSGPCRALIPRYYYDRDVQRCRFFYYGGCQGNANNFASLEGCERACGRIPRVPRLCRLPGCGGPGEHYFFNLSSMACERLGSGGCPGGHNRFPDPQTCAAFCTPVKSPTFCYSPPEGGLCSANVTRYYFHWQSRSCQTFVYTGCGGNENNFVSLRDCTRVCVKALKQKLRKLPWLSSAPKEPTRPTRAVEGRRHGGN